MLLINSPSVTPKNILHGLVHLLWQWSWRIVLDVQMPSITIPLSWNTSKISVLLLIYQLMLFACREVQTFPNFFAAFSAVMGLIVFGTAFFLPPLHYLLEKFVLPAPGQGPSEEFMDSSFLKVDGYAKGSNGTKVKTMIYFPTDPGYRDTVRVYVYFSSIKFIFVLGENVGRVWLSYCR